MSENPRRRLWLVLFVWKFLRNDVFVIFLYDLGTILVETYRVDHVCSVYVSVYV